MGFIARLWEARDSLIWDSCPRVFSWDLLGLWVTAAGSPRDFEALFWACWHL